MAVTTFEMDSDSAAPTLAGSALIPFARRWSASWNDIDARHTLLRVEHPAEDAGLVVERVLGADPNVHLV